MDQNKENVIDLTLSDNEKEGDTSSGVLFKLVNNSKVKVKWHTLYIMIKVQYDCFF